MAIGNHLDAHVMGSPFFLRRSRARTLTSIFLAGGYEFLMENCTSIMGPPFYSSERFSFPILH
jgi:hypothetical protein